MKKYTSLIRKTRREIVIDDINQENQENRKNIPILNDSFDNNIYQQSISQQVQQPIQQVEQISQPISRQVQQPIKQPISRQVQQPISRQVQQNIKKEILTIPIEQMKTPIVNIPNVPQTATMKEFLIQSGVQFDGNFIRIPSWCKRVKIDCGLSGNAPQSKVWLDSEDDLLIFGFEPVPENINMIKTASSPWPIKLNPKDINNRIYIIPCALGNVDNGSVISFNVTENDTGCSSMFEPSSFKIKQKVNVPIWSLKHFFQLFPFHIIPYIDFIKTDCQGADLDILKGAKEYINKIAIITIEAEDSQYKKTDNGLKSITNYLNNFNRVYINTTDDPTFYNKQLLNEITNNNIICYQIG